MIFRHINNPWKCLHNLSPFTPEITPARAPLFTALCDWSLSEEARRETLKMIGRITLDSFLTMIGQNEPAFVTGELILLIKHLLIEPSSPRIGFFFVKKIFRILTKTWVEKVLKNKFYLFL